MNKVAFREWLLVKRSLKPKSAQDALSRCKRLEKALNVSLEQVVASQKAFNSTLAHILRIMPHRNDVLYAMRLYAAFKNPKIDVRKHGTYRGTMRKADSR